MAGGASLPGMAEGQRRRPKAHTSPDPYCQMNVRIRQTMKADIEARAARVGVGRDEWMRRVLEWALAQPDATKVASTYRPRADGIRRD